MKLKLAFTYLDYQNAKYTVQNVPVFLYDVTMLIFQIKRIISSKKWFNYVATFLFFFFFQNAKNLGRSDDARQRKKEDGLIKQQQIPLLHRELVKAGYKFS